MITRKKQSYAFVYIILCCVLTLCACNCINDTEIGMQTEPIQAKFFEVTAYQLSEEIPENIIITENRIIGNFVEYSQEYTEAYERYLQDNSLMTQQAGPSDLSGNPVYPDNRIRIYDHKGQLLKEINLNEELGPTENRRIIIETPSGDFCVLSVYVDFLSFETVYQLAGFNIDGTMKSTIELLPNEYIENIQSVCIDGNGDIFIAGWGMDYIDKVYVFDSNGRRKNLIETEPVTLPDLLLIDDQVYLSASIFRDGQYRESLFRLEKSKMKLSDPIIIPETYPVERPIFAYGNSFFTYDQQKMVEYSLQTNSVREIVNWNHTDAGIDVFAARILPEQKIICVGLSQVTGFMTICELTGTNQDPLLGQKEIVVAGLGLIDDSDVQALVHRFNSTHEDCRIILRDYDDKIAKGLSWKQMIPEIRRIMLLDLFSENSPDIYLDIDGNLSLIDYSNKDYLMELTPMIENSEYLTEENYIMDIMKSARRDEGTYFIPTCFSVNCFSGFPETIRGEETWTIDEFNDMVDGLPENTVIQSALTKEKLLDWALQSSIDEYVDFDTMVANFSGDRFIDLLEWVDRYGIESSSFEITSHVDSALKFAYIDSLENIMNNYNYYGRQLEYIGFPGNYSEGLAFYPRYIFAISSQTTDVEKCWDFIFDALSEEFQITHFPYANPINRNAVQFRIETARKEMAGSGSNMFTDEQLTNGSLLYWDILERADQMLIRSDTISTVVLEESSAFFAGYKTADEVADLIQNRVQNMINERQ